MQRKLVSTDLKYERLIGYSRAIRVGDIVFVSGTSGLSSTGKDNYNNSYDQTKCAIEKVRASLEEVGSRLEDVVRTRLFLSRRADWKQVAKAHREFFGDIMPASSMIVCEFLDSRILVEIEAEAIVNPSKRKS
jgi:enamine deaminase RidA (YjgF/YER057c/UK114 family)